jgi:hypothetical protein
MISRSKLCRSPRMRAGAAILSTKLRHVMIVGAEAKSMMQGYPRDAKPAPTKPYVMWPGTPNEHLMLPVK